MLVIAVVGKESELQAKLRIFRERKELVAIENALGPVLTDRAPTMAEAPSWVAEATARFWEIETEPDAVISDDAEPDALAAWTEEQLARHGIEGNCYAATHLSIRPWISCAQAPGWTRLLRTAVKEPIVVLSADVGTVVAFLELEYVHAVFTATA
ncbi:MAG: hypothetical protein J2P25_01510 [Nocardiopsaceae bacterium]|nr:hypothetical protein [Nocardiopsaceae bacterium]